MKPIAITMGDPSGIGPEIIVKAFIHEPELTQNCFVVGDVAAMRRAVGFVTSGYESAIKIEAILEAKIGTQPAYSLPELLSIKVLQIGELQEGVIDAEPFEIGKISAKSGKAAADAVVWAARAALKGQIAALVTAPLHKEALALAGGEVSWTYRAVAGRICCFFRQKHRASTRSDDAGERGITHCFGEHPHVAAGRD
jgi:4-hydroxythreonine-4-phosphate dehydrogenase